MRKLLVIFLIAFLSLTVLAAIREINKHDLSTRKPTLCNLKVKGPVYLITYGDGDVYIANQKVLAESALGNCVDVVYMYRKEHIDEGFYTKNKAILEQPRGAGYWLWKPYIVMKTLEQIPENAVVIYLDSGFKITGPLDGFINNLEENDIVLMSSQEKCTNKEWVKRALLRFFDMDNETALNAEQIGGGSFALRNTPLARKFIERWLEVSQVPGLIDDTRSPDEHPQLIENRHDQSILSLVYLENPGGVKMALDTEVKEVLWLHRRRNIDKTLYVDKIHGNRDSLSVLINMTLFTIHNLFRK